MVLLQKIKYRLVFCTIGIFAALYPSATLAAERITFSFKPFGQFQIKVEDLSAFVATGETTTELDYYLQRLTPEQLARLPELLSTPLKFPPLTVAKFSNSTVGEVAIANLGKGIRASPTRNGLYALRGAIIAAAFDDSGLSLINLLRHYPLETVHLDLEVMTQYLQRATKIAQNRQEIYQTWFTEGDRSNSSSIPAAKIQALGEYKWQKQTLSYQNTNRDRTGLFDLYQPESVGSVPVIAISHGMASNRQTFAYLGKHLASYGFAVAIIEHSEISLDKFDRVLAGTEPFPEADNLIGHPLDISAVLDRLESEPELKARLNLDRVGIIGQSFGGYGALALAGGKLSPKLIPQSARKKVMPTFY